MLNGTINKIKITWAGHSTFLISYNGINILTDPCFSDSLTPIPHHSVKRSASPGIKLEDIQDKIDLTIITHKHRDHLEWRTIRKLKNSIFLIPKGLGPNFSRRMIPNAKEMKLGESFDFKDLKIESVLMKHWCLKKMHIDRELCFGWVINFGDKKILFCGDTDYDASMFKKIRRKFNHFDITFIPIGGYYSYSFVKLLKKIWKVNHINPHQAVQIHKDINSRLSIGMHWGTFQLSKEKPEEVLATLDEAKKRASVQDNKFITLKIGESIFV